MQRSSRIKEDSIEVANSLLEKIIENVGNDDEDADDDGVVGVEEKASLLQQNLSLSVTNDDGDDGVVCADEKASLLEENLSLAEMSTNSEEPMQDRNPLVSWVEPKRGRKIQTTSLLLKRKKKIKRRPKKKLVLRLRGGSYDEEENGGMDSNDEGMTLKLAKRKPESSTEEMGDRQAKKPRRRSWSEFSNEANRQSVRSLERPYSWQYWEQNRQTLRPPPLESPRRPDLAYMNMTVDEAQNEDGIEHYDPKDAYRRTDAQIDVVKTAQRDQRNVAGGIYQCLEDGKENLYLHIMKGAGKLLGIKLVRVEHHQKPKVLFETFAEMKYERYIQCSSQRVRVNLPEETETGFIWYGHGGNRYLFSSSVYEFCERVDNNIHFSAVGCERITEAPGASQFLCSNKSCGIIFWHLSVMFFHRLKPYHFEKAGEEHFAVMMMKSGGQVLLWTDQAGKQTRWARLEHSPAFEKVEVFPGSLKRIGYVVAEGLLPQTNFSLPAYSPMLRTWDEPQPLERVPTTCNW